MCLKNHMLFYDYIYPQKWHNWPRNYTIDSFTIIISTTHLPQERHWSKKVYCKWYCWKMKHFLHGIFTFWKFGNILARILMAQNQFPKDLLPRKKCNLLMQVFYSKIIGIDALCFRWIVCIYKNGVAVFRKD